MVMRIPSFRRYLHPPGIQSTEYKIDSAVNGSNAISTETRNSLVVGFALALLDSPILGHKFLGVEYSFFPRNERRWKSLVVGFARISLILQRALRS